MSTVKLSEVTKVYPDGTEAVKLLSLDVESQELLILAGPSGCGKTTVLRMIAGLEEISEGDIYIDDQKVNDISPRKRDVSMVFQNYALYPHMTVYENMTFGLRMRKVDPKQIKKRVDEVSDLLDISNILHRKPRVLSGGQQQRVALGRAIVRRPKVFLLDEPLSNLDAHSRAKMRTELSRLHTRLATTMVYVTHDQLEAMTMGEKIVLMNNGQVQQIGNPIEIYEKPANKFVAGFFGNPPINFFKGYIIAEGHQLKFQTSSITFAIPTSKNPALIPYKGETVLMGMRPEHIHTSEQFVEHSQETMVSAYAEVIEPMGPETLVYVSSDQHDYVVRCKAHERICVGQNIDLYFNMSKSIFFDTNTEQLII